MAGTEARWRTRRYLVNDPLTEEQPMLYDLGANPDCTRDAWDRFPQVGQDMTANQRAFISLSQTLLNENRVYPPAGE